MELNIFINQNMDLNFEKAVIKYIFKTIDKFVNLYKICYKLKMLY